MVTAGLVAGLVGSVPDATAQPAPTDRIVLWLGGGVRPASRTFASSRVFPAFFELANFQASYDIGQGRIVDGGMAFRLWRNLGVGLDLSRYRSVNQAQIRTELPHPFFFDLPRSTMGEVGGLKRLELGAHIRAIWMMQFVEWLVVSVSGGPSLISAQQDLVSSVEHREGEFPFDEIFLSGHTTTGQSQTTLGANVGVDIDAFVLDKLPFVNRFEVARHIGVGVLIRYMRGSVDLLVGEDPVEVDLGGLHVTAAVRLRF